MSEADIELKGSGVLVPEHRVPSPPTISEQARAALDNPAYIPDRNYPDLSDAEAWRQIAKATDANLEARMKPAFEASGCALAEHDVDGVAIYELTPPNLKDEAEDRAVYYVHGGGFLYGSGLTAAYMAAPTAATAGLRTFAIDYRVPPDHCYPVGLDDCLAGYRWMLDRFPAENIATAGASAGGGLAASMILKARDAGLPLPAACVLATPEVDLTESGDTFETNWMVDVVLRERLTDSIALYADGADLNDPYLSPLLGDFTKGFSPTVLTSGTRDLFLSNTVRMHRLLLAAGIEAELHVWEAMPHGGFSGAPEDVEVAMQQASFIRRKLGL